MNPLPAILVIIVTWNKKQYVIDLLHSLDSINYPRERLDIVVVDNASRDGTVEILRQQFAHIHVIANQENLGGCGGFNTGLAWAFAQPPEKYAYLWLLDNDVLVHQNALIELVGILQKNNDIAIAGSTMMQLTSPWRINEMGAFVDRGRGTLLLNRHREKVPGWRGRPLQTLLTEKVDLSHHLEHCRPWMDVDYVAAASLLVRAPVAKTAGLWEDYFIHFDDVEWCLRIAEMGHRIAVSARSLIWHLPAENKVPTWILYYDNRNVLYLLEKHSGAAAVKGTKKWILKKSLYYALLGKQDLACLHLAAIEDFDKRKTGRKDIQLEACYKPLAAVEEVLANPRVRRVLIPYTVNLQACDLQSIFVQAIKKRPELRVDYLLPSSKLQDALRWQLPGDAVPLYISDCKPRRLYRYMRLRGQYDLVLQSDYQPILSLSWIGKELLFVNHEGINIRQRPNLKKIFYHIKNMTMSCPVRLLI